VKFKILQTSAYQPSGSSMAYKIIIVHEVKGVKV